ncbi:hypothetical protein BBO99_00001413 [Phytophthora kernoviae]|uniref:FHA domain-containing protein n=2 Tax=Phytophthora kernoviae TaxID=325452 RepID=A0A421F601_9STRA|nr:hypothetical protein G195_002169 [Phytophthora kernoviae 00238/432]KAG2530521.1 hypothetical protein JM16_000901 [Phytophthora kernoviae]KAG2531274.1 hypothetical protein JM18_001680 [Phytophthora kernoviae]RLN26142.1 hypothetical protein BBI17_001282 [Phytophthora kernoviae]RLN84311.1 hypothetical protein BBO99_00001413 [Phytophthora kernoviae]
MKEEEQEQSAPWGRFALVSKDPAEESDHIYFSKKVTTIGRNPRRCDYVINQLFISSILEGVDDAGEPLIKLSDNSRNGIWVNAERIGKGSSAPLGNGFTVHFTKPGTTPPGVTPMAYKVELLTISTPDSQSEVHEAQANNSFNTTLGGDENFEMTQQAVVGEASTDATSEVTSPSEKKRKRVDQEPAVVPVTSQDLEAKLKAAEAKLKAAEVQVKAAKLQIKAAESKVESMTEELERNMRAKLSKVEQESMTLMSKLEETTAENLKLKTDLAAKAKNLELKLEEAAKQYKRDLETNRDAKSQNMETKLKEATKKFQQKVEAEHYEQRREMSEKMAAYNKENSQLQATVVSKVEELAECEDTITTLREKISALEEQVSESKSKVDKLPEYEKKISELSTKETELAECEEKISELEEKITASKDENSEIIGLLAAAEEKAAVAEEKASRAAIAAAASASIIADANERRDLQASIVSFRSELEGHRVQLTRWEEEAKKQREATALKTAVTAATVAIPAPNVNSESTIAADGGDAVTLRAQLAAALDLFGQVQALGLRGMEQLAGSSSQALGDLHLLSAASLESACTNATISSSSTSPTKCQEKDALVTKADKKPATDKTKKVVIVHDDIDHALAEPKSPSKKMWEKKRANKQAAPLSAVIETNAASAIAAMAAAAESSAKSSPSDASTAVVNDDTRDGDWEMLK